MVFLSFRWFSCFSCRRRNIILHAFRLFDRLQFTHSCGMWPKWLGNHRSLQRNARRSKKICIFCWDHNKLHYNLWICAFNTEVARWLHTEKCRNRPPIKCNGIVCGLTIIIHLYQLLDSNSHSFNVIGDIWSNMITSERNSSLSCGWFSRSTRVENAIDPKTPTNFARWLFMIIFDQYLTVTKEEWKSNKIGSDQQW